MPLSDGFQGSHRVSHWEDFGSFIFGLLAIKEVALTGVLSCRVLESSQAGSSVDAYGILGVDADAKAADIKKRYWRLSLLIHPDKCPHLRANDAFQAVSKAAKDLQVYEPYIL